MIIILQINDIIVSHNLSISSFCDKIVSSHPLYALFLKSPINQLSFKKLSYIIFELVLCTLKNSIRYTGTLT